MSRRDEIEKAAINYATAGNPSTRPNTFDKGAFEAGAEWADSNPDKDIIQEKLTKTIEQYAESKEQVAKLVEALEWISDFNMGESNLRDDIIDIKSRARKVLSEIRGQKE